ncbi:hypothetical protein EDD22DRAFT_949875 [Suillus occidentalis]|nr:hypothetical protein EDD22DRAFT_949875 [Suillus occidentalis]
MFNGSNDIIFVRHRAATLASGCKVQITITSTLNEITQNKALGDEFADVVLKRYGAIDYEWGIKSASTDFASVSHTQKVRQN